MSVVLQQYKDDIWQSPSGAAIPPWESNTTTRRRHNAGFTKRDCHLVA